MSADPRSGASPLPKPFLLETLPSYCGSASPVKAGQAKMVWVCVSWEVTKRTSLVASVDTLSLSSRERFWAVNALCISEGRVTFLRQSLLCQPMPLPAHHSLCIISL